MLGAIIFALVAAVGIACIVLIAKSAAVNDNKKYDTSVNPCKSIKMDKYIPEGFVSEPMYYQSTTYVTVDPDDARKTKKAKPSLQEQLDEAVENEEYEIAAKLRDKINKLKK